MKARIGHQLRFFRDEKNLTQIQMADLLKIAEATYARYERNETQVDYEKMVKFANSLNIPIQELLPETVAITNNNSGQGGSVVFGNQNVYIGDSIVNQTLSKENQELKDELLSLKQKIDKMSAIVDALDTTTTK